MLPEVIKLIAERLSKDSKEIDNIIKLAQSKVMQFLKERIQEQAILFTVQKYNNQINTLCSTKVNNLEDYSSNIKSIFNYEKIKDINSKIVKEFNDIIENNDYIGALRIINDKGLLPFTNIANQFGWTKGNYMEFVLRILRENKEDAKELRNVLKRYVTAEK